MQRAGIPGAQASAPSAYFAINQRARVEVPELVDHQPNFADKPPSTGMIAPFTNDEIGRASCRARCGSRSGSPEWHRDTRRRAKRSFSSMATREVITERVR